MKQFINDLCEFINGGAWSDQEYSNEGIPVLKVSNLKSEGIDFSKIDYIPETSRKKYSKHILRKGDLVVATVGSHPSLVNSAAGRASIIPKNAEGFLLNQNAVCIRTKNPEILDQLYLAYIGKTSTFQHFIQQRGKGAANQMRIAIGAIKEFEIILPDIDTQRKISSILSAYDDLIENNLNRINLLEELAQSTYEEWFLKFCINGNQLLKNNKTNLPQGWGKKKITNCHSFEQCKNKISRFIGEMVYIATADIESTQIISEGEKVNWVNKPSRAQIFPPKESVWFARMSNTYKVLLLTSNSANNFIISSGFAGFIAKNRFCLPFLYCLINSKAFHGLKDSFATGATQVSLNDISLNSIEIIEPDIKSIEQFGKIFIPFLELKQTLFYQNKKLKESRDILLPRLMSGEIEVKGLKEEELAIAAEPETLYKSR